MSYISNELKEASEVTCINIYNHNTTNLKLQICKDFELLGVYKHQLINNHYYFVLKDIQIELLYCPITKITFVIDKDKHLTKYYQEIDQVIKNLKGVYNVSYSIK